MINYSGKFKSPITTAQGNHIKRHHTVCVKTKPLRDVSHRIQGHFKMKPEDIKVLEEPKKQVQAGCLTLRNPKRNDQAKVIQTTRGASMT